MEKKMTAISSVHDILSFPCQIEGIVAAAVCKQIDRKNRPFLKGFLFASDPNQASIITALFRRTKQMSEEIEQPLLKHITLSGTAPKDCFIEFTIKEPRFSSYARIFEVITKAMLYLSETPIGEMKEISIQEMHSCKVSV